MKLWPTFWIEYGVEVQLLTALPVKNVPKKHAKRVAVNVLELPDVPCTHRIARSPVVSEDSSSLDINGAMKACPASA